MGKFIQRTIDIRQSDIDGIFKTISNLTFVTNSIKGKENERIFVKSGYVTDGYSKPTIKELWHIVKKRPYLIPLLPFTILFISDGSFDDDLRPAIIHDYLSEHQGYFMAGTDYFVPVSFREANDVFYEAMRAVRINKKKALLMRLAVEFNPNKW